VNAFREAVIKCRNALKEREQVQQRSDVRGCTCDDLCGCHKYLFTIGRCLGRTVEGELRPEAGIDVKDLGRGSIVGFFHLGQ